MTKLDHRRLAAIAFVVSAAAAAGCTRPPPDAVAETTANASDAAAATTVATAGGTESAARPSDWREITLPAGTRLPIVLETAVGSDISRAEESVQARLSRAVSVHGEPALPEGSRVSGVVTQATRSGRVKGRAQLAVRFTTLVVRSDDAADARYSIETTTVARSAAAGKKKDALEIGGPAAGGALIGALLGGRKGALVGTAVGGGAGTAVVLSTRGREVRLAKGAALTLRLAQPVTVRVRER